MLQKTPRKNQHTPITIVSLLFLISLGYALYSTYGPFNTKEAVSEKHQKIPEYFDYGVLYDRIYCNDFFEFKIPILKGHEATYKKYDYITKSIYERDSISATPQRTAAISDQDLLVIVPELVKIDVVKSFMETKSIEDWQQYSKEKSKRDMFGPDYQLIIRAHNLREESLGRYINQFQNLHNPDYGTPKFKEISGISFRAYEGLESFGGAVQQTTFKMMGGENKKISSYVTEMHGFALSIDLFYLTEEQKCILLEMVNAIRFHASSGI